MYYKQKIDSTPISHLHFLPLILSITTGWHNPEVASNKFSTDKKLKCCFYHHVLTDDCIPSMHISAKERYHKSLYTWPSVL